MQTVKTPAEIARIFGCTEEQARKQMEWTVASLRKDLEKCTASKSGKLRGFPCAWYADRVAAFEAALQ